MRKRRLLTKLRTVAAAVTVAGLLAGCTIAGPAAIHSGRMAYNEAIRETNNQQMLMVPVHNRYEESNHILAVASVTANVRVSSRASVEAGFGNSDNYDGNLVPFSGGFIYEENPTISYKPVAGEAYLQQLASPIPLPLFLQVTQMLPDARFAYTTLLGSINGIHNPAFLYDGQQDDPRFDRVVEILAGLTQEQQLHWVTGEGDIASMYMVILDAENNDRVPELLNLLQLPANTARAGRLTIPVSMALYTPDRQGIEMTTRSLWELVEILSAAVAVPASDEASGIATGFPAPGITGRELSINYSEQRPEDAYVAVEYRDGWYFIDRHDRTTKRYFKLLGSLWSAAINRSLDDASASPVLTVPVSR